MYKKKHSHITGILIDPVKQTIEYVDLPERNDAALRSVINQLLQTECFVFDFELENKDVAAVDFAGHTSPRNWPFLITSGRLAIPFGRVLILGSDRGMHQVVSAASTIIDIKSMVTFGTRAFRIQKFHKLEGYPALPRALPSFIPDF